MQEVNFYLEIQGEKIEVNEPIGFRDVEFTIKQNEDYFGRNKMVAGEKATINFNSYRHENVFNRLINEFMTYGFNSEVYFYVNDLKMRIDFETATTDYYSYFECQALESSYIYELDYNKDVKIDINSDLDAKGEPSEKVRMRRTYVDAMGINRRSYWKNNEDIEVGTTTNRSLLLINTIAQIQESGIKNTLTAGADYFRRDWNSWWARKMFQFISFKDNYKDVELKIKIKGTYKIRNTRLVEDARLVIFIGDESKEDADWYNSAQKIVVATVSRNTGDYSINVEGTYRINNVSRGSGIWMCWENRIDFSGGGTTGVYFNDTGSELDVVGTSFSFGSIIESCRYVDAIKNVLYKITKQRFDVNYNDTTFNDLYFSGNQVRFMSGEKCYLTWKDIEEQLKERGLGYELIGTTLNIREVEYFHNNTKAESFLFASDLETFEITEDDKYNVNTLIYKYKKFQAQKDNAIEGNAGTTNGESEWYIQNIFTDKKLNIDLPIARDKFLLEETRTQSFAYNENTKTNEDDTQYLFEGEVKSVFVEDVAVIASRFNEDSGIQSFAIIDDSVGWEKLGLTLNNLIYFDIDGGYKEYIVREISGGVIHCLRINHTSESNEQRSFLFRFSASNDYYIDLRHSNNTRTIKQNLLHMKSYLNNYNYYTNKEIVNTVYKENGNFEYLNIKETDPIPKFNSAFKPKKVTVRCFDTEGKIEKYLENRNGYVTVIRPDGVEIDIYPTEISYKMAVSDCGNMEYNIIGMLKN